jgi:hypothetical protein
MWQNAPAMLESNDPKVEFVNYYGNASLFALSSLQEHGSLDQMNLLRWASTPALQGRLARKSFPASQIFAHSR